MRIIKHGDPNRSSRLSKFRCVECGCEWIAGPHEVYRNIGGLECACYCPDCHELTREARGAEAEEICPAK